MFKSLFTKYATDFAAKIIASGATIAITKGIGPADLINTAANNLTGLVTVLIALGATTGIKALNDNFHK